MFNQIGAVTMINLRSIPQRAGLSLATVISIALVTGVLLRGALLRRLTCLCACCAPVRQDQSTSCFIFLD